MTKFRPVLALLCAGFFTAAGFSADDLDSARQQCAELGFKPKTEQFGKCVLQLSRSAEGKPALEAAPVNEQNKPRLPQPKTPPETIGRVLKDCVDCPEVVAPVISAGKPEVATPMSATSSPKQSVLAVEKPADKTQYVVRVATLSDPAKARQIRDRIAATGIKVYAEIVATSVGNVTRVIAGPFGSRGEADEVHDKLKTLGLSSNVVPK